MFFSKKTHDLRTQTHCLYTGKALWTTSDLFRKTERTISLTLWRTYITPLSTIIHYTHANNKEKMAI